MTDVQRTLTNKLTQALNAGHIDRRQFLRWSSIFGLSLHLPAVAARAQEATPEPVRGGILRFGVEPAATINPHQLNDDPGIGTVHQASEMLIDIDYEGLLQPRLATSWTPDETGQEWTVELRQGVTFHDGRPMTSADVVATFQRLVNPDSGSSAVATFDFLTGEGMTASGDHTVVFSLTRPVVDFPAYLSSYQAVILPADWEGDWTANPVGTGAFVVEEIVPQQRVVYSRNENYWAEGLPYLDGVEAITLAPDAQITAILGGSIETTNNPAGLPLFQDNPDIKVLTVNGSGHDGIFMRVDQEPFSSKQVRQAMALCMGRPELIAAVWQGLGELGNDHVIAPVFPLHTPIEQRQQDYDQARALLAEAGLPDGFSATLTTSSDTAPLPTMAAVVQQMLEPAGIQIEINAVPSATYFNTDWLQTPLNITNWGGRATPSQYLATAYVTGAVWNASHWSNPAFDELVTRLDSELDFAVRQEIALEIEEIMKDEVPAIIAFFINSAAFVRANVQGYLPDRIGFRDYRRTFLSPAS